MKTVSQNTPQFIQLQHQRIIRLSWLPASSLMNSASTSGRSILASFHSG